MTQAIKTAITSLKNLKLGAPFGEEPLISLIRPWMIITDLELLDAIHLNLNDLREQLSSIRDSLTDVIDIVDEDQLQEAACRKIKSINVYADMIPDRDVAERAKLTINWDGGKWLYITDPKLRMTESSTSYKEARKAVFGMLDRT
jgi:hypothetical protein